MGLDTQLRDSMLSHADDAPAGADLLDGVRLRDRRFRRRRWMAVSGGLAVVLVVVSFPLMDGGDRQDPGFALPRPNLVPADFEMPYFPYELTWMPSGASEVEVKYTYEKGVSASAEVDGGVFGVSVSDRKIESVGMVGDEETATAVNGHPAKQLVGPFPVYGTRVELSWEQDGRWIMVHAAGPITAAEVKRVGEGLRPGRIEARTPIRLRMAPEDWVVSSLGSATVTDPPNVVVAHSHELCLTRPGTLHDYFQHMCVVVDDRWTGAPDDPTTKKVMVNGNEAWLTPTDTAGPSLMFQSGKWAFYLETGEGPQLSDDDLIRFAEGVSMVDP